MKDIRDTLFGTAGGIIGSIGGISCGMLLIVVMLFVFFCVIPFVCFLVWVNGQPDSHYYLAILHSMA